jgi:GT2 family glycosyltransferase
MPVPKVSFVIPVLNLVRPLNKKKFFMPRSTVIDLVSDIEKNVDLDYEIIVVCNNTDEKLIKFATKTPSISKYVLNSVNPGIARSWNMGVNMSEGEYLFIVNDDVRIGKNSVEKLIQHMDANPKVGVTGPRGVLWNKDGHVKYVGESEISVADAISGFAFAIRSTAFHEVGGFDINYTPAGCEEIDFSFRISRSGWTNVVIPNLDIHHNEHHGISSFRTTIKYFDSEIDTYNLHERNFAYLTNKWFVG